ncbi:MAG: NAD(P)/FAD-dependent oxidoreductase [Lachnospiraceae bacterium]
MRAAVIGAGASGMTAAITAARLGHGVTLYERQARAGRKLMATGNGRCNLTNTGAAPANYHGEAPAFVRPALEGFGPAEALDFFRGLGLLVREEHGGRVYPLSNSANSVVDVLRQGLEAAGVRLAAGDRVRELRRAGAGFSVLTESGEKQNFDAVVSRLRRPRGGEAGRRPGRLRAAEVPGPHAHGPASGAGADNDGAGLSALAQGHRGRLRPAPRLRRRGAGPSEGRLLFTETGSPAPRPSTSRARSRRRARRRWSWRRTSCGTTPVGEALEHLRRRAGAAPGLPVSELFTGSVHNRLGRMLVKYAGLDAGKALSELTERELRAAAGACKRFSLPVRGTEGFASAQVTAGGVRTSEFCPETLESRIVPHLFACGEVLDIDGDCGGYNLQWAWSSGASPDAWARPQA